MAGGRAPKDKGTVYEREVLAKLAALDIAAERTWGSNGASRGLHKEVDLILEPHSFLAEQYGQAKRPASIPAYIQPPIGTGYKLYCKRRDAYYLALRLPDFAHWYVTKELPKEIVPVNPFRGVGKGFLPTDAVLFQIFRQDNDTKGDVVVLRWNDVV